jgi:hypothetical protein
MRVMRTIVTAVFLAMAMTGCAYTHTLPPAELVVQNVVEAPGVSKERIFEKSKVWFARTFRQSMSGWVEQNSRRTVLQYEHKESGVLIANGAILYPHEGFTSESYKTGWEVRFTLEVEAKDGKARVTFNRLAMFVPSIICGYYSLRTSSYERPLYDEEFEKAKPQFLDLADQFGAFLKSPEEKW